MDWIQHLTEHSQQHHESSSSLEGWNKQRSPLSATPTVAPPQSSAMNSVTPQSYTMEDIMGDTASASASSQSFGYMNFPASTYTPFNVQSPYASQLASFSLNTPWSSNYSSLNGATTSTAASPPGQNHASALAIDPSLMFNGPSSTPSYPQSSVATRQHAMQYHNGGTYPHYQQLQNQPSAGTQGVLSAHSLHNLSASTSSLINAISPSIFTQTPTPQITIPQPSSQTFNPIVKPPPPPTISPQERRQQLITSIQPLLQSSQLTGAQAVQSLVQKIDDYGLQDVDTPTRLVILTKIRDGAGNPYFRAWAENPTAMEISKEWLKASFNANGDNSLVDTIMPLLHIIDRLPLTLESLKASKLGKLVVKLHKEPPSPAIKDMAFNIERRWRKLLTDSATGPGKSAPVEGNGSEVKKRKLADGPTSKAAAPPSKKQAVASTSTSTTTAVKQKAVPKKEIKPVVVKAEPGKDVKSDSSFFSAPKPKPKLPTFRKGAPSASSQADSNVAQPSSIDPFQEALKSMGKRKDSPAAPTPPPTSTSTPPLGSGVSIVKKKKKVVSWPPDHMLESIKFIDRAIYDDDPAEGQHVSLRDLDRSEGAALHRHLFEESMDWSEPLPINFPSEPPERPRGLNSVEKAAQETREQNALGAAYMSLHNVPESPAEPTSIIADEEIDKDICVMTLGPQFDFDWGVAAEPMAMQPSGSVADLIAQLNQPMDQVAAFDHSVANAAYPPVPSVHQDQLSQVLAQLSSAVYQPQQAAGYDNNADHQQPWGAPSHMQVDYSQQQHEFQQDQERDRWGARGGRGGRGRGRGGFEGGGIRGSRRKPCMFFQSGRCKFGDQCDFSHDLAVPG